MTEAVDLSNILPREPIQLPPPETEGLGFSPTEVPCTIHLKDGGVVKVKKVAAWAYVPQGIFVDDGEWNKKAGVCDLLIPHDQVRIIELHYDLLKEYLLAERPVADAPSD